MALRLRERLDELKTSFERLSARERGSLATLLVVVVVMMFLGGGYYMYLSLDDARTENEAIRLALRDLSRYGDDYRRQQAQNAAFDALTSGTPLELNSYVEKAASAIGISISESRETNPSQGAEFTQRGLEVKLRKVTLGQLSSFLKQLEESPNHVVQVTELDVGTSWGAKENQELEVELTISTYEKVSGGGAKESKRKGS